MYRRGRSAHDSALPATSWQGFTFVSQNQQKTQDTAVPSSVLQNKGSSLQLLLSQTQVNDRVCIITLPQGAKDLAVIGLVSGIAVRIVSRTASGSVIVSLSGKNLGIGSAIALAVSNSLLSCDCGADRHPTARDDTDAPSRLWHNSERSPVKPQCSQSRG